MKKIIFPFCNKYPKLGIHWWHRFFVAIFFILITVMPIFLYITLVNSDIQSWQGCANQFNFDFWNRTDPLGWSKVVENVCGPNAIIHYRDNLLFAIVSMILISYLLQIIYYKIFLYIVLGKRLHEPN
jgi:hypothetical protein